jgi:hypothetical protein
MLRFAEDLPDDLRLRYRIGQPVESWAQDRQIEVTGDRVLRQSTVHDLEHVKQ